MRLQRQYDAEQRVTHVRVIETGAQPEQNFSHRLVEQGVSDGWVVLDTDAGTLVIKAEPEDLLFVLLATPGYYCVSTGERIPVTQIAWDRMRATGLGDLSHRETQFWLKANGKAPDDYRVTNAYECRLAEEQHERFRAVKDIAGNLVAAYLAEAAEVEV